jgi:hypothetical protein
MSPRPWVVLAALVAGCATIPPCPGQGGPAWREVTGQHFVLHTDLRAGKASEALTDLENLRAAILNAAFPRAGRAPGGQIPVILVDDDDHWREYFPHNDGMFTEVLWQPLILMRAGTGFNPQQIVKHELVHHLSRFYLPKQPRWFAEGLATYFETLTYDVEAKEVTFGQTPQDQLRWVQAGGIMPLPRLIEGSDFVYKYMQDSFYSSSWLLVHYLANQRPEEFSNYQRNLLTLDETSAWQRAFGPDSLTALPQELTRYLQGGRYLVLTNNFHPPAVTPIARVDSDAEAHVQRALLHYVGSRTQPHEAPALGRALANVEEALRQEPTNVLALCVRYFLLEVPVDEPIARAALKQHPDDWRAWALLAGVLQGTPAAQEGEAALKHARLLAAANPAIDFDGGAGHH